LLKLVEKHRFMGDPEYRAAMKMSSDDHDGGLPYFLFLPAESTLAPEDVFPHLRWGGRVVMISSQARPMDEWERRLGRWDGFVLEEPAAVIRTGPFGLAIAGLSRKAHYLVARKVDLLKPGEASERFTYAVRLGKRNPLDEQYVVIKRIPTVDSTVSRLRRKFPDSPLDEIHRRAVQFTEKIFPVFLTREASMLRILQRHLPQPFCDRVPRCLGVERDSRGFVRTLYMNWLRNGGAGLGQLDFAIQSAELLAVLHEKAGVIHLDLRLDNFVCTEQGVGLVDFGSAVRVGEKFADHSLLFNLYEEMMRTSQIQRVLSRMSEQGLVTSHVLRHGMHRVDRAVDLFYLSVQMNKPHSNPDFKGLIRYNPNSLEARHLQQLTDDVLRPTDSKNIPYRTVRDLLHGLYRVREAVAAGRPATASLRRLEPTGAAPSAPGKPAVTPPCVSPPAGMLAPVAG
jgi:hypothetical protein